MSPLPRQVASLLRRAGAARSRDLEAAGLQRGQISRLTAAGALTRVARGIYALPDREPGEYDALIAVAKRAPGVVFCLLTALRIHDLTSEAPFEVWIAIPNKGRPPRLDYPILRTVRLAPESLAAGVETRRIGGTRVRVTSVAKTVADCFKFRNRIGLDVALEALRQARRTRKASSEELWAYAKLNRIANVMRPYLEGVS